MNRQQQQQQQQQQITTTSTSSLSNTGQRSVNRTEQHVTRQFTQTTQRQVHEGFIVQQSTPKFGNDAAPPVFEQIFKNARFAQGGNAVFEGKVTGIPKPFVSWTRKGAPLLESNKYKMTYDQQTGNVVLTINQIGPGDEGEYTCSARNQYGEAICSVFIQPEGHTVQIPQGTYGSQRIQQTQNTLYTNNYSNIDEDFKVDTFEYRLLREVSFRQSVTKRYLGEEDVKFTSSAHQGPVVAPQVLQKPRNSKLVEGSTATFTVKVSTAKDTRLTWFKNGQRLVNGPKHQINFTNQVATLSIPQVCCEDSGHYTLLVENPQGCVVSSAYLAVEPTSIAYDRTEDKENVITKTHNKLESIEVVEGKMLAPNFVRVCGDRDVTEGKLTRFDVRVTGKPYPEVSWYINGQQIKDDATHKILVNESGDHGLMITNVSQADAGQVVCVARSKSGETSFQCNLGVVEKELVVSPKFVQRFTPLNINEGETVTLSVRAVGTPVPRITWQKDGVNISEQPGMVSVWTEGGGSVLEIARASTTDAGWYQCTAQNTAGSTATRARLNVIRKPRPEDFSEDRRLRLPKPTRVIEPEPEPEPEVVFLKHVERAKYHTPRPEEDKIYPPPRFIVPLANISQQEDGRIHFEARIEPIGDPTMVAEWFVNGYPLQASSRAMTLLNYGFIALDLLGIISDDAGEYTCRVTSSSGTAQSTAVLKVEGRDEIDKSSQYPDSLKYIEQLEDYSKYQRSDSYDEVQPLPPTLVKSLHDMGNLQEGRNAHFEAQLNPVSDPTMKVEWYKDGKPITASSRITTIFNFGYVSLNIMHLRAEDSGEYTLRAINRWGEIISTSTLNVIAHSSITGDLGYPEQQRYIDQTEALEQSYLQQKNQEYKISAPESVAPPQFKTPIKDQQNIKEGGFAHFEARLEPLGDSTLQVEWLKDGKPVEASSRMTVFFNFGYVALTIKYVTVFDIGTYTCRAYNNLGDASTSATLTVLTRKDVVQDSQHPGGLERFQYLEDSRKNKRKAEEETVVTQKPRFLGPLKGTNKIAEGQRAHFEVRVEPQNDVTMKIEWYFNGRVIMSANRIQTYHDFGYVALDILGVRAEDSGTYVVVARNALGEAQLSSTMQVEVRSNIDTSTMHRGVVEKAPYLESKKFTEPQYDIEEISKSRPIFIQPLSDPAPLNEGKNVHLECRLEPMGDPTMRVEWFQNGKPVTVGSRFRTYYDFGYVALDIIHVISIDSGEYTVRATNHLGSAHTSACVNVLCRSDILTESQNEYALEQIQMLEDASRYQKMTTEEESIMQSPQFTKPLHNIQTSEGTNVHLECRLKPVGDPTMKIDWLVNGRPVKTGHRFRPAYDFDYVALDLLSVYPEDSGVYTCQARNEMGEAVTSSSVKVIAKKNLILDSQHPHGLEKIQYLEDSARYKKAEMIEESVKIKPRFLSKPKNVENLKEGQHAHFECKLEPVTDSNLEVQWFKNGKPIIIGHRFRPIHDFGYVALDIIDVIEEDTGTYTCRAVNLLGVDETNVHLTCRSSSGIVTDTQNEMGLEQIQYLEEKSRYNRREDIEETTTQAPIFTTSLKHCDIKEGQRAHFECRLIPVSDNTMKVEWFHNNVPIKFGSRFTETNNFGFVALDILQCLPEDSGTYTCRATNWLGQSITSGNLNVQSRKSIYLESQHEDALGRLAQLENSNRYQRQSIIEDAVTQAPVFTQPMRDSTLIESQPAHFEARLIPVGDDKLKVEWLRNGIPIQASNRVSTMHDFGYVALNLKYVYPEDSGTYTCRAINDLGQAVTSATLNVHSKASLQLESQHEAALDKLRQLEDSNRYKRTEQKEVEVTEAPKFIVPLNGTESLIEGQSAHYECRIEPYPDHTLQLEWLHNGKPLQTGHRFRTTYDFGFASLDVLSALPEDSGEYTCRAINKLGRAESSVKLGVQSRASIISDTQHQGALNKIQYLEDDSRFKRAAAEDVLMTEKPQFGRPLKNIEHLPEGRSVHLEATLIPVNDPTMKVEWYRNGIPIPQGHRFKTVYDFGFVALDVLYAYPEDSGTYMCKAKNAAGEAVTTCIVTVDSKSGLQLDTLDEDRLKKIKQLEAYERPTAQEAVFELQKPVFLTPLNSLELLKEGEHAHLETRIEPINDADLKIEWFVNGVAIKTGHRFKTTHDFGYVALDILYAYAEDSGTYMCKATNKKGEAVNTCQINVASRRSIYLETQHPDGLEKIRELEAQGRPAKLEINEPTPTAPTLTDLWGTTEVAEGKTAHFECQVKPVHDSKLKVEFFHNDKPLGSASRFHTTYDFGYISLDIGHVVPEDAGKYTVKATNELGQATSNINLLVQGGGSIILDSQRPEGLEKIKELEMAVPFKRADYSEPISKQRPMFTQPLQNIDSINEGQTAHFECRLIPIGDSSMTVEWFRNEKPLETSSRITKTYDFGYISLDISHVRDEDNGVYSCKATNALGEAVSTASMRVRTKSDIQLESQHPEGLKKIVELERGQEPLKREEAERSYEKPIFTQLLTGPSELIEGQHAHFECRVVPVGDPTLRFEWYVNGVELKMGSRFQVTNDFGFVTLDISSTVAEDSGVYTCKAINRAGEAVSSTSMKIKHRSSIIHEPIQPDAWEKIQLKEAEMNKVPEMFIDTRPQQAPVFTSHLQNQDRLAEGQHVHLEAQVEPRADPNLRIEWFKNGVTLTTGSRIRSTFDFGLVTLAINSLRPDDSAIYTCKASNLLGEAVSTCTLKISDSHWLLSNTLHPESLSKIEDLEKPHAGQVEGPEPVFESPVFISHLNNWECKEGSDVHFECQVEPSKDPTLKIDWFVNGKPLQSAARFKSAYDFGFVTLDIHHAYSEDSGIYTCKASNSKGQAVTTGTLKCTGLQGIHLDTQHPQGKTGLEKVQKVEDNLASKYQRQASLPDAAFPKPIFVVPLEAEFILAESKPLHLEAQVEPKNDPNLKIEWYFNGKVLDLGSRFKTNNDFGFISLDLTDVYERDQGVYTCKAYNHSGETYTSTTVYCSSNKGLIEHTQHPKGEEGLEKIQSLEESLQRQKQGITDKETGHAPVFTSQFKDLGFLSEGEIAHYEASLTPVGDQKMVVEWFYNGNAIEASHRIRTIYAFGMVVLEILGTKIADTGTYTCKATNDYGSAEMSVTLECVERITGQKPKFTSQIQTLVGLKDGDSAHFECTLIPVNDPDLKVEWFHNGQPLLHKNRVKMISDFGFVVMDIAYIQNHDSGEYVCKASNKYGEDITKATIQYSGKGGVYLDSLQPTSLARIRELENATGQPSGFASSPVLEAPKFTTQLVDITNLKEGQSAHFEARVTPVNDPNLVVEWYFNGEKLQHGHRFRTFHDFGIVILDILYCYEENSGVYECRAFNKAGTDTTKANLRCSSKTNLILDSQLPRGMEGGLEKIQTLEDLTLRVRDERVSVENRQAPMFTEPLSNIDSLREGESAHFEGRLTPVDDPNLKVEWFWNGKPLKAGSRFRTFCEFGFVILEISPVYPEDSGEYSCRATNHYGEAVTTASMKVQGKRSIIFESQLPKGMDTTIDRIAELEGLGKSRATIETEDELGRAPEFITTPGDLSLSENSLAHFECRLVPSNDASMTVTWFHNGKVLSAGSRIKTINDFGFVILEVAGVYIRDSGLYTCKATNKHGEATVSCKLQVKGRQGIVLEPQLPNTFRSGTKSIQKLEENMYKKEEILPEDEKPNPPRFTVELKDALDVQEAKSVHFECRVEPVNDSTLRIDWFFNGKPFATGSRVHVINDFGFISLDMDYVYSRDSGEYICRATNKWGTAFTKAKLTCTAKQNVILESQLPDGMSGEKLKALEQGPVQEKKIHDEIEAMPPKFLAQIESTTIEEASSMHFETRVEPKNDPKLRVEWYRNGKPLPSGHRYKSIFDLGFVSLDILSMYSEDSGEYICRAVNDHGEAITKAMVTCKQLPTILLQNQVPKGMKKSEALTQMEAAIKKYTSEIHLTIDDLYEVEKKQPPRFVTQIKDQLSLVEMESTKFECQLAPVGDPNMKVEWFLNGQPLRHKNRFNPIYDFGYVAMNFGWIYPEDSGEYVCRATNLYGQDETRATIKTSGKPGIIYDSQLPKGMKSIEKIREMEASWQVTPEMKEEEEKRREPPQFVSKPEPVTICEGDWARFCCRVTGFPRPRVMWLVNGNTVVNGMRYKLNYDGMWHLDIPKTRQYDHGKVEVIARNACGETRVETMLTVNSRHDDYRGVLKNSPRPWYDSDLVQYQRDLKENELDKVFTDRASNVQNVDYSNMIISTVGAQMKKNQLNESKPEWTEAVKQKKNEDYYSKLSKLEGDQVVKEARIREASHQVSLAGEKLKTTSKNMSSNHEESLDKKEELMPWQKTKLLKARGDQSQQIIPDPSESSVHGKEIHVAKQQQTQKEVQGDKEIRRKITATETTEVEHTRKNQERVVQGKVEPSKPPIFTTKIQPCRAFEQDQARFEVEFDGEPLPTIKWYREDFLIQNSPDFQIHTFSTKSILVIRQVFMEDSGVFAVIAENRGGKAKCSANLLVEERKQVGRKGPGPPSFLTTMQGAVVKAGQLVRFDVKISANKPLDVYWLKNGKKITQDIRYKTVDEDNQYTLLIIESVTEDSGTYECVAINNSGEARCEAPLLVQPLEQKDKPKSKPSGKEQAPTITQPLSGQVIHEGQPVTFSCKISGQPPITVKWQKGDKVIKPSKYFRMTQDGETVSLHISEVFPEDEGTYKCLVSNAGGQAVLSANLKVIVPENQDVAPTLSPMRDVIVPEGNAAQFRTQVTGQPSPSVQWFREGTLIPETPDFKMMYEGNMAVLLITSTYEEDSGVFTCRATNSAGQVETSAKLTVKNSEEIGEAPTFVEPIKPRKVRGKKSIELRCIVKGIPIPEIIWCRENEEIISDDDEYRTSFDSKTGEAILTLVNPLEVDRSTYLARAVNIHGKSECMAHITFEKEEYGEAPKFVERLKPKVVKANETTELTCLVKGVPSPSVVWCRDDEEIIPDESHKLIYIPETGVSKLIIVHPDDIDESTYTVNAINKFGRAECRANLIVQKDELGEAPTFVQPVKPKIAKANEITELKCFVRGTPKPLVIWCRGNDEIIPDECHLVTYHQDTGESILTILNPTEIDETIYTVNAVNKYGQAQCRANLIIQKDESGEAPIFVEPIKPNIAKANEATELNCLVRGIPTPTVVWFRGDVEIIPDTTHSITFIPETGESKLVISKATEVDQNTYTVKATNKYGRAQCRANVIIQEDVFGVAPSFVEPIKPVLAKPDQTTVLRCLVTGNPMPTVVWCRGKDEIVSDDMHTIQFIPETGESTLTIVKPTTVDEAHYSVEAINKFGRAICRANLVLEKYDTGIAPAFVVPIKPKAVKPTETVELRCVVTGTPMPTIVWCRGDEQIVPDDSHVVSYTPETGESKLTICNATGLDVNDYTVKAVNDFGVAQCKANLIIDDVVREIPKPEEAPSITKPLQPVIAKKDSCVTLDVHFRGTPELKVRWFHNGKDITDKKTFMRTITITETTTVIIIKKITKKTTGRYEVVVTNKRGEAKTSTTVLIEDEDDVEESIVPEEAVVGKAPYFETELQTETIWEEEEEEEEETIIRLVVRVKGSPKPKVHWYENGMEITPSEEFEIEEQDEGVSVLTVKKRPTESVREITCEATNEYGTATTRTLIIPGIKGTKAYRKPSWVTQMEELREQLQAFQSLPSFVNELKDERAVENETIVFECQFSGNPTPVIIWYHDDKIVRNSSNVQVKITDTKTTLTIKRATKEDEGVYICKANSNLGEAKNKSKLYVKKHGDETFTATEDEVEEKEVEEVKKTKKTKKKATKKKHKKESESFNETETKESLRITTSKMVEEKPSLPEHEPLSTSETVSDETVKEVRGPEHVRPKPSEEPALFTALKVRKPAVVHEVDQVLDQVELAEFGPAEWPLRELATIEILTRHGISTEQVFEEYTSGQFPALRTAPAQSAMVHLIEREGYTSLVADVFTKESTIPETVNEVFKAFMTMIELKHSTLEEIITYLTPEDFQTSTWDFEHASQMTTDDTITDTADISESVNILVNEVKKKTRSTKNLVKTSEETLSIDNSTLQEDSHDGEIMFAIRSYIAENEDALDLVEGEKVYVIESNNQEWWFVKKHLTEEKGWVPSIYLRDETSYMRYVQKKLHEKIDKLPIFQRHASTEKPSAPRFVEKLQPKHVPDGGTVQFECHVEGNPRPQITWFRQTAIIKPSQDFQIFYDEDNVATLIIREVFPEDAGTFTCVAKNVAGFASSTTELTVEAPLSDHGSDITGLSRKSMSRESSLADILEGIPPTFSRKPKATCASEHTDVTIECRLVAVPEPDIFWHYNGREISITDSIKVNTYSDMHFYVSCIKINDVLKTQEGVYSVIARNREGEAKMDLVLKVKTGLPEKPQILEPLYDITINEGETAVLSTQISGEPQPMVEWLKNSKKITDIKTVVTKDGVHSLTIDNPTPRDSAKYTVIASNKLGNAQTTCFLAVEELPGPQAPLFIERFQEQTVKEKGTITLIAKVTGNPVPIVSWFRNNKPLLASSKKKEVFDGENIVLEIVNADSEEDAGDYKCVASNTFGTATHGARVSVDVPQVKFTRPLTDVEVDEKESIYLECETSHTVSTKWQLNGKDLTGMDHRELHQEGRFHRLIIKKSSILDSGKYTCLVKDQITSSTVVVHDVKAEFVKKLEDVEVKENDCAILEVEVSSETVNVTWHKNGEMLTDGMNNKVFFEKEGQNRKLIIRSISVHDDGEYTCSLGEQECTAEINVIELAPQIIKKLKDQKVATGEQVLFEIELTKGDALVKWTKDGKELQLNNNVRLTIDGKRQKLEIVKATRTDTGVYGCQVHEQTCTAKLTVEEPRASFVKKLPDITLAVQGSDIKLTVELSKPDVPVKWLRSGKVIKESDKYEIISEGAVHTLVIKKPTTDDEAEYICTAVNVKTSTKLKVEVKEEPPKINNLPKEYRLKNGEDLNVDVTFTSTPLPTVEWFINGSVLIKTNRVSYSISESSASLTISKIEEVDTGVLTLKLKNIYGETTADMNIIVIKVPGEPGVPDVIEVTDTSVTLHWKPPQFDGNSPIEGYVVEYHDKDEFMVWHKVQVTDTTHEVTSLITGHEIMFKVAAMNCAGVGPSSHNTKYIKMASPGSFTPPAIQEPLSDLSIGMGKSAVLQCVITGKPTPDIKWLKNKTLYKTKTTSFENHVAKLTIAECNESTTGTYTCQATNGAGTAQTSCKLSVQDVPKIEVHESETSQMIRVRNQWKVKATYKGYPKPTISWQKNSQPLPVADKHINVYDDNDEWSSTIAIYSVERPDTGVYTIIASNAAGTATCNLNLKVIDKPSAPQGPMRIKEINSDSVTIEWNKPSDDGGLDISAYQVERCNVGKMIWSKVADVDHDVSAYSVQKLHEDAEYMFRVCAQNAVGASDFLDSEPVTVKCRYHKPSAPQGPLQITGVTDTSSTIAWLPPLDNGGIAIEDYCVEIKEVDKKAWRKIGSTKDLHIKVLDLKKGSSYDIRITARNHVGYGKPYQPDEPLVAGKRINFRNGISDETLYVLMGIFPTRPKVSASPSPPTEFTVSDITSKSVTLHWGPPESNGGSEITGYVIEKQLNTTHKWFKVATLEPTVMKYCVENLKEKSEYFFKIYAENCIGLSQPVETKLVSLLTHATVPSPPTAPLEVRNLSTNAVIVEWGVPETDGGAPLLGYNIAIRDEKKTMWMEVGRVEADVQKFNIKDLQENHRYQIRILAKNEVGVSEPLETEEPYTVQKPTDYYESDVEESVMESKPSLTQTSETTTSWLRDNNMDADISSYSNAALLKRSEYFFRIWYYARTLFK